MVYTLAIQRPGSKIDPTTIEETINMSNSIENYGWTDVCQPESSNYITPKIIELLQSNPSIGKVCDVGSGNGALCSALDKHGFSPCGIEYDVNGYNLARNNYSNIPFFNFGVQDDPEPVTNELGKFDAVVSTEVIEHLFSPHLLPQFSKKLLKPEGILIISTPYHGYLKNLALSIFGKWDKHHTALWHGGHIKFFSRSTLTKLLEDNGFEVIKFSGAGRVPYLWKSMIIVAKSR